MNIFVFDIETIPDVEKGRRLYDLEGIDDEAVAEVMFKQAMEQTGQSFVRLPLHKIAAISVLFRHENHLKIWSLGDVDASEKEIVQRFFDGIEKFTPQLVSWNGTAFDLPVLQYRALINQVVAPRYWESGEKDSQFKWNNYTSRYHQRHLDLMDVLAGFQPRANASLHDIATLLGFPGKFGMDGSQVWKEYCAGNLLGIRQYCETDVINTYLVYLRFQLMRGGLTEKDLESEIALLKKTLKDADEPHFKDFLSAWATSSSRG